MNEEKYTLKMDDGQEITMIRVSGEGTTPGLREAFTVSMWQASTKWNTTAYGATEAEAVASLYNRLYPNL